MYYKANYTRYSTFLNYQKGVKKLLHKKLQKRLD